VADVSGKGVAAAFCMAHVNEMLCRENPIDMFVTAFYAELDQVTGVVSFVNAGHCEPIVTGADGSARLLERTGNLPLGVMPQETFAEKSFTLAAGEMLFLYTDGVTEAADRSGDMFRVRRLLDIARRSAGRSPDELMLAVIDGVERFSVGTVQADDITCLAIRRKMVASA
jgi:sigma-B regulation protein RsbU (phosphoserine phosphatase)